MGTRVDDRIHLPFFRRQTRTNQRRSLIWTNKKIVYYHFKSPPVSIFRLYFSGSSKIPLKAAQPGKFRASSFHRNVSSSSSSPSRPNLSGESKGLSSRDKAKSGQAYFIHTITMTWGNKKYLNSIYTLTKGKHNCTFPFFLYENTTQIWVINKIGENAFSKRNVLNPQKVQRQDTQNGFRSFCAKF